MIHGKWYKGNEDLSALGRKIDDRDLYSWHLVIYNDDGKEGNLSLEPFEDSFCMRDIFSNGDETLELMLRMVNAKLFDFKKERVYCQNPPKSIVVYGFSPYKEDILKADKLLLPKHCKE